YFDIKGAKTGLLSKAMTAPDGLVRIPLNESSDPKSQINEYLEAYNGEGIQHIACFTDDIYSTVEKMIAAGVKFLDTPDTYFEAVDVRIPNHGEDLERLRRNKILIDADPETKQRKLLQIFTQNAVGPIFFEIIQRKGNEGFGEGNFQALFESIERDQMRRGVL
ncbi:MAG: 4-hydroxyphenylpyruvate dioxygenase family protein, partial [Arenimonas sp.]